MPYVIIGCLVFIILLTISYNTKKFNFRLSNKAYKFLIYDQIVMLLFEILTAIIFENTSSKFVINLTNRLTWTTGIVYFYMFYIYSFVHLKKLNYKSIRDMLKDNIEPRLFTYSQPGDVLFPGRTFCGFSSAIKFFSL